MPGAAEICALPEKEGKGLNTWRGLPPMHAPKDWKQRAKPFLEHVAFLVPVAKERKRFIQWLAHIVQCPEVLPHTFYVMIAKNTGIGRNLAVGMVTRALRGHVANGVSLPDLLRERLYRTVVRKLLVTVDELREGSSGKRWERQEALKRLVTEESRYINPKYGVPSIEKNCGRWWMLSNHLDAIPFDSTDRRAIIIENPLTPKAPEYYARLYAMLDDPLFSASIRKTLEEFSIADFNPGEHAPVNAAKQKALKSMLTDVERACQQFRDDCEHDLASRADIEWLASNGGYGKREVNPYHLTRAIEAAGMANPHRQITLAGARLYVVVVRNHDIWTRERVQAASTEVLAKAMGK